MIVQRYGDLEIGYSTNWQPHGPPQGETISPAGGIRPEGQWRVLGSVLSPEHGNVSEWLQGGFGGLVVRDRSAGGVLLAPPVDFYWVANLGAMPGWFLWRPVPPPGYVALGDVWGAWQSPPDASALGLVCVRRNHGGRDYVRQGEHGRTPLRALHPNMAAWPITPPLFPADDTTERLLLPAGTFSCGPNTPHGPTHVTWVLDLPAVVDSTGYDPDLRLDSYNPPAPRSVVTDRTVTVPYVMVTDNARPESWKVANSPFYRVQRRRQFDLIRHVDFRGQGGGQISEEVEQGVSRERSSEFSTTTGLTVGVSVGVEASAKPFGVGATTTVETSVSTSIELGYARRYGVTTFEHKRVGVSYDVPAGHAGALWSDTHELVPVRRDGTLVTNANLRLNAGYYVGRTFPHGPSTTVTARTLSADEITITHDDAEPDPETIEAETGAE